MDVNDYNEYDHEEEEDLEEEEEEEEEDPEEKKNAQIAEWNEQSKQLTSTRDHIYVLTLEEVGHDHEPWTTIVGVFDSKAAAVAKSVTVQTDYGAFDNAIKDMFYDDHIDNRMNPPDNGVLVQIGGEGCGEGDYSRLMIKKHSIVCLEEPKAKITSKRTVSKKDCSDYSHAQKKQKISNDDVIIILDDSDTE